MTGSPRLRCGQSTCAGVQSVPASARRQSGGLVGVGRRGFCGRQGTGSAGLAECRVRLLPLVPRGSRVDGCPRESAKPQVSGLVMVHFGSVRTAVGHRFRGSCITLVHHFAPVTGDPVAADADMLKDLTCREDMLAFGSILTCCLFATAYLGCRTWTWQSASRRCAA